ncbi:Hypothetical protein W5S_1203 [Pectobacterium parmentieri]|uniref:Uncharacterized protein n=1 Tax=Pectobacterium parmentieri TaxID=1905730 RepID=A0A0H3I1R2_PECPM|nr:Hypothetical protein W5S_1203 [Pectobacterium parmentieri]
MNNIQEETLSKCDDAFGLTDSKNSFFSKEICFHTCTVFFSYVYYYRCGCIFWHVTKKYDRWSCDYNVTGIYSFNCREEHSNYKRHWRSGNFFA